MSDPRLELEIVISITRHSLESENGMGAKMILKCTKLGMVLSLEPKLLLKH